MLLLPLYLQVDRWRRRPLNPLGPLMVPQGLGAAARDADQRAAPTGSAAARSSSFGMLVVTGATIAMRLDGPHPVRRHLGQPVRARDRLRLRVHAGHGRRLLDRLPGRGPARHDGPRTCFSESGRPIGVALLAVILEERIKAAIPEAASAAARSSRFRDSVRVRIAEPLAHAFTSTFWWAVALTALAAIPAFVLATTARTAPARHRPRRRPASPLTLRPAGPVGPGGRRWWRLLGCGPGGGAARARAPRVMGI